MLHRKDCFAVLAQIIVSATSHVSHVYSCPLHISESTLWGFPSSNFLNGIIPLPQVMLAALTKILSSLALGAGILERLWETSAYLSIQRFWLSLVNDRGKVYYLLNAA